MFAALAGAVLALGASAPTTTVEVHLDVDARRLRGQVEVRIDNPTGAPLSRAYVWLYPNRFGRPPAGLDDVSYYWVYPRRFNPGRMRLDRVEAGGRRAVATAQPHATAGRDTLWAIDLPAPVPPGQTLVLRMSYRGLVPERYGTFGCIDGGCTLAGGFYPMLAAIDPGGWDLSAPPARTDVDVTVHLARPAGVILGSDVVATAGVASASSRASGVPYASLFVAPRWHETTRQVGDASVVFLSRDAPPPADDARGQILPYTKENYARYALDAAQKSIELLGVLGVEVPARRIAIVEAPLRSRLATAQPGVIAVSDRWYRIWPAKRLRKFHDRQLARAVFGLLYRDWLTGIESERDLDSAADLVASYLMDLFTIARFDKTETAADILQPVRFLPVIDQVLYAPQLMFADAYFGSVSEDERLREDPLSFNHDRPRGRLLYEKLKDLLTPQALPVAMRAIAVDRARVVTATEAAYGGSLDWFYRQWSLPQARVNYRLGAVETTRTGGRYHHELAVEKHVAPGDDAPIEPVDLLVVDDGGARTRLRWSGQSSRGRLRFDTAAPISYIALDPRQRLVESRLPGDDNHELYDNRRPQRIRFVYNSFGVLLNVSDLSGLLAADFSISRAHDLRNRMRFLVFTSAQSTIGAAGTFTRDYGPSVTADRLLSDWFASLSARRLRESFFDEGRPGTELSAGVGVSQNDREFAWEPRDSRDSFASVQGSVTRVDGAGGGDPRYLLSGTGSVGYTALATPRGGHTFALDTGAAIAFGDLEQRSQLLTGGGIGGSRGYAPGALFGRWRAELHLEYRHIYVHDLSWNFGHYSFLRGIGGAAFVDLVGLGGEDAYGLDAAGLYPLVGYGVRFFYDSFGTLQQMMRLDVAMRLDELAAPAVYLTFVPPF